MDARSEVTLQADGSTAVIVVPTRLLERVCERREVARRRTVKEESTGVTLRPSQER